MHLLMWAIHSAFSVGVAANTANDFLGEMICHPFFQAARWEGWWVGERGMVGGRERDGGWEREGWWEGWREGWWVGEKRRGDGGWERGWYIQILISAHPSSLNNPQRRDTEQ